MRVPTLAEMARIKTWLLATRRTVRDYLDAVVLLDRLGDVAGIAALQRFDAIYAQLGGASPLAEVIEALAAAAPIDLARVDVSTFRGLIAPWTDWTHVVTRGRHHAALLARLLLEGADADA